MSEPGLTDAELLRVEDGLGFAFADDHRAFLAGQLPTGAGWPNWRGGLRSLQKQVQLPVDGILYAVEWDGFWHDRWGPRPARMKDALRSANYHLARAPRLVPVHGHHYLPAGRGTSGRPVLSVVRTEVAVVGTTLADYLDRAGALGDVPLETVEFWSELSS